MLEHTGRIYLDDVKQYVPKIIQVPASINTLIFCRQEDYLLIKALNFRVNKLYLYTGIYILLWKIEGPESKVDICSLSSETKEEVRAITKNSN